MSFISVTDAAGNPLKYINVRLALGHQSVDDAYDDRFTDLAGHTAFPNPLESDEGYSLYVNFANVQPDYGTAQQYVEDLDAGDITFVLESHASPVPPEPGKGELTTIHCPQNANIKGYGKGQHGDEWYLIAHTIVSQQHLTVIDQGNLAIFQAELQKVHARCRLQADSAGMLKPRIFLPTDPEIEPEAPCNKYSRVVDIGDFGEPFFSGAGGTDEWVRTGLPPGSDW